MANEDILKNIKFDPDISARLFEATNNTHAHLAELRERASEIALDEAMAKAEVRKATLESRDLLKQIESKLHSMEEMMVVLKDNSTHQAEILEVITEILKMSQSENKQDAESKFKKINDKLFKFKDHQELYQFLSNMLISGYNTAVTLLT